MFVPGYRSIRSRETLWVRTQRPLKMHRDEANAKIINLKVNVYWEIPSQEGKLPM